MCVEITASVRYLRFDASEAVLYYVSYSIKKVLSDWMSGWVKRDGVLSSRDNGNREREMRNEK